MTRARIIWRLIFAAAGFAVVIVIWNLFAWSDTSSLSEKVIVNSVAVVAVIIGLVIGYYRNSKT
jgi:hypothetical protein